MRISEVKNVVGFVCSNGEVPMLVGHAGIGKTESIKQLAIDTGRKLHILMLSQMEPGDLLGLPVKDPAANRTIYLKPDWFPEDGNSILFLDEINRAHESVRHAVMQLILDRRINNHVLPDGVWIVAAMNPSTEDYSVDDLEDAAFLDRFVWIKAVSNTKDFMEYLASKEYKAGNIMTQVVQQMDEHGIDIQMAGEFELPELSITPRAFERLTKLYSAMDEGFASKYLYEIARGILGTKSAQIVELIRTVEKNMKFSLDSLLKGDVEAARKADSLEKIQVFESLAIKIARKEIDAAKCSNAVKVLLEGYTAEEQMSILRQLIDKSSGDVFNGLVMLKEKSKEFTALLHDMIKRSGGFGEFIKGVTGGGK